MKRKLLFWLTLILANTGYSAEAGNEYLHIQSFGELKQALQDPLEQKSVLLVFLGADWCPWSQKFLQEVILHPFFKEGIHELTKVMLVPYHHEAKESIYENFQVAELPTCVLLTSQGQVITQFGYMPYSPSDLMAFLKERLNTFARLERNLNLDRQKPLTLEELKDNYQAAKLIKCSDFQEAFLSLGLIREEGCFFLLEKYMQMVATGRKNSSIARHLRKQIAEKDPRNELGSEFDLAVIDFQANSEKYKNKKQIQKVIQPLLQYIAKYKKQDQSHVWQAEMMVANYLFSQDRLQDAVHYAKLCLDNAPDNLKTQVQLTLEFIQQKLRNKKEEKTH